MTSNSKTTSADTALNGHQDDCHCRRCAVDLRGSTGAKLTRKPRAAAKGATMNIKTLRAAGFDGSKHIPFSWPSAYDVKCSQCAALVINGTPTHERGCPNQVHECRGCNASVPRAGAYCEDCQ
jgi:hypothetical protein